MSRFDNAVAIQQGACNPSGIALTIVEACREIRAEPDFRGTAYLTADPALRLMVHQLAFICGVISGAEELAAKPDYFDCMQACREKTTKSVA